MKLGEKIKCLREQRNFSQRALMIKSGLSNSTIARIENNEVSPSVETLSKIAKALNVPMNIFLDDSDTLYKDFIKNMPLDKDIEVIHRAYLDMKPTEKTKFKNVLTATFDILFDDSDDE